MLILVEGCDKAGKSTIISDLSVLMSAKVFKNKYKIKDADPTEIGKIAGIYLGAYNLGNYFDYLIFDRSHITELVYCEKRGYEAIDYHDWNKQEEELEAILIYMEADRETIAERFKTDNEDYLSEKEIDMILRRYDEYLKGTKIPYIRLSSLDRRIDNASKALNFIIETKKRYGHQ